MEKSLIGIHINSSAISLVKSDGTNVFLRVPENLINQEGIISPETLSDYLAKVKKTYHVTGSDCAFVLPDQATFFRTFETAVVPEEQLKLNLPFEFKDFVGSGIDNYYYDYVVDGVKNDANGVPETLIISAAAAQKDVVNEYAEVLKKAGFKLKLALPNEMCAINVVKQLGKPEKELCLIGVGYRHTRVYIFNGNTLRADKLIDLGNYDIDKVIAQNEHIDESAASNLRMKNQDNILGCMYLKDIYEQIGLEVMKAINFYKYQYNDTTLDTAYFYGLGYNNMYLSNIICNNIDFKKGETKELLPGDFKDPRTLIAIGLII